MYVRITLGGSFDSTIAADLRELSDMLAENGVDASLSTISVPGVKVELAVGIAIASLAVSSVSTLINVINFWRGQKSSSYRMTVDLGGVQVSGDQVSVDTLKQSADAGQSVTFLIEKL